MSEPTWKINKRRRNHDYDKEHTKRITVMFYENDWHYVDIWKSIPNKAEWLRQKLDEYEKEGS